MVFLKNYYSLKNMSLALLLFISFFPSRISLCSSRWFFNFLPSECFVRHPVIKALNFTATKLCSEAFVLSSFRSHCLLSPYDAPRAEASSALYAVLFGAFGVFK